MDPTHCGIFGVDVVDMVDKDAFVVVIIASTSLRIKSSNVSIFTLSCSWDELLLLFGTTTTVDDDDVDEAEVDIEVPVLPVATVFVLVDDPEDRGDDCLPPFFRTTVFPIVTVQNSIGQY